MKTQLGWALSGPLPQQEATQLSTSCMLSNEGDQLAEQVCAWWDIESYASGCTVSGRLKDDTIALQNLERTTKFDGERYEVGLLWKAEQPQLPNNLGSAMGQLNSLENRLDKDPELKDRYQQTIDVDLENGFVRKLDGAELNETRGTRQWYVPHHPVVNPHKPEKVRRACNAAAKYQAIWSIKLLTVPDLSQSLTGIVFRFREHEVAMTADIEAMFLQVKVPPEDCKVLRFLRRRDKSQPVEVYEYTRHVFGAKSSPTCANYALNQVAKDVGP